MAAFEITKLTKLTFALMKFKALFVLLFILSIGFSSCDKTEYIEKSDIEIENGFVKGTLKGELKDGMKIDERFNLIYSSPGNNIVSDSGGYSNNFIYLSRVRVILAEDGD